MGNRRSFLGAMTAVALAAPLPGRGQARLPRVVLTTRVDALAEALVAGLKERGWIDGRNFAFERVVTTPGEPLAKDIERALNADAAVVVLSSAIAIGIGAKLNRRAPLVGVDMESDPVAAGFAKSLARPGGNITGVWLDLPELVGKNLQLLRELSPGLSSVGVLWDERIGQAQYRALVAAARDARLSVHDARAGQASELEPAIERVSREGAGSLIVLTAPLTFQNRESIAVLALKRKLPLASLFTAYPAAGGLVAYGPSLTGMFRQAAGHVDRILRGAKPGDIPIERPASFELVINAMTAKKLGIAIPESLRMRADRMIDA